MEGVKGPAPGASSGGRKPGATSLRLPVVPTNLAVDILPQPDLSTCGPTCLHAVYRYYGLNLPLEKVVREVRQFEEGGTLGVLLGLHALSRGFKATLYTYNLSLFDPTWFLPGAPDLAERLRSQMKHKRGKKFHIASEAYIEFLQRGGRLRFEDLSPRLLRGFLNHGHPILTGLSATYLYRSPREFGDQSEYDDIRGESAGHFVIVCGYDSEARAVLVADPLQPNPMAPQQLYPVPIERLICAILLGILSFDGNLLVVEPEPEKKPGGAKESRRIEKPLP